MNLVVSGYKINIWETITFLYTNQELSEREIRETTPFTVTSKVIKYPQISLPKKFKDLYSEN